MSLIAIMAPEELYDAAEIADTRRGTPGDDGGTVPGRLAGYVYNGAHYCPDCASEVRVESSSGETYTIDHFPPDEHDPSGFGVGIVAGTFEVDYPGAICDVCGDILETNILISDSGGAHPDPVVEALDPDGVRDPARAFLLERDHGKVRIMLAEVFGSHGDPGDITWLPESDIVE